MQMEFSTAQLYASIKPDESLTRRGSASQTKASVTAENAATAQNVQIEEVTTVVELVIKDQNIEICIPEATQPDVCQKTN